MTGVTILAIVALPIVRLHTGNDFQRKFQTRGVAWSTNNKGFLYAIFSKIGTVDDEQVGVIKVDHGIL